MDLSTLNFLYAETVTPEAYELSGQEIEFVFCRFTFKPVLSVIIAPPAISTSVSSTPSPCHKVGSEKWIVILDIGCDY
jgi:hypothetical protein